MASQAYSQHPIRLVLSWIRVVPIAGAAAAAAGLCAWSSRGSIAAVDWLPTALLLAGLLAAVLASGTAVQPSPTALTALAGTIGLAAWAGISSSWSPLPSVGRDEALLTLTYALAFALPLVLVRTDRERLAAAATVAAAAGALVLAVGLDLSFGADSAVHFEIGRLEFPIAYANAQAAVVLIGLWPALAVAAERAAPVVARALATGIAAAVLAGWLATQSKGGAIGIGAAAVVVFGVFRGRLRLAVPALIAGLCAAAAARPLTEPYRVLGGEVEPAAADAGTAILVVFSAATVLGALYALLDRRTKLSPRQVRLAGWGAAIALVAALTVLSFVFVSAFGRPDRALSRGWDSFSTYYQDPGGTTHLGTLGGSNRYDFWRVALNGSRDHPIAGIGARGFQAEYLQHGRSGETPARAHSLPMDVLLELGVVGLALLLVAIVPALILCARAVRAGAMYGVAALGGALGWLGHAAVDWTWTFAATGIPFFLLLGIGASHGASPLIRQRIALAAVAATLLAALVVLTPTWLSDRLTKRALLDPAHAQDDLRLARRLDPLSVRPLLAQATIAPTPEAALPPLRRAADKEPRSVGVRYRLGTALLAANRPAEARRELEAAAALAPRDELIENTLARIRR